MHLNRAIMPRTKGQPEIMKTTTGLKDSIFKSLPSNFLFCLSQFDTA